MQYSVIGIIIIAILMILFLIKNKLGSSAVDPSLNQDNNLTYRKKEYLLTQAENSFYSVLKLALEDMKVNIFSKVRLGDIVYIPKGTKNWQAHWNKIQSKHVDFVICSENGNKILLVIELNDASHNNNKRLQRDEFVDKVLGCANIPFIFFPVQQSYSLNDIFDKVKSAIEN